MAKVFMGYNSRGKPAYSDVKTLKVKNRLGHMVGSILLFKDRGNIVYSSVVPMGTRSMFLGTGGAKTVATAKAKALKLFTAKNLKRVRGY